MQIFYCNNSTVFFPASKMVTVMPPKFEGGPGLISITPPTNGPKVNDLRVLVGREFGTNIPERGTLSKTKSGYPIIVTERDDDKTGALVFFRCTHWVHRTGERPNLTKGPGWGEVVLWQDGYGKFGYGYIALLKLMPGEWHFSTPARWWERVGVILSQSGQLSVKMWSPEEFQELTGQKGEQG